MIDGLLRQALADISSFRDETVIIMGLDNRVSALLTEIRDKAAPVVTRDPL